MTIILTSKDISLGGILTALTLIVLYLTVVLPINKLTLLALASFMITIALIRRNIKTALFVYISSCVLAFFMVPINIALLYATPFGIYNLIKYFIEQVQKSSLQLFLKFITFNMLLAISFGLISLFIAVPSFEHFYGVLSRFTFLKLTHHTLIIPWAFSMVFFILFDYGLTLLERYYHNYFTHKKS